MEWTEAGGVLVDFILVFSIIGTASTCNMGRYFRWDTRLSATMSGMLLLHLYCTRRLANYVDLAPETVSHHPRYITSITLRSILAIAATRSSKQSLLRDIGGRDTVDPSFALNAVYVLVPFGITLMTSHF
mmetsp:Transcript_78834/g.123056  ORF Transcript_78834/g.123056 Transcript_78834/m.123056 type:complete len:130 (+) Transcript_78834:47-436(+)